MQERSPSLFRFQRAIIQSWQRLSKAILGLGVMVGLSWMPPAVGAETQSNSLEKRVEAVQAKLQQSRIQSNGNISQPQLAQWWNWGNWPNNWGNWGNYWYNY